MPTETQTRSRAGACCSISSGGPDHSFLHSAGATHGLKGDIPSPQAEAADGVQEAVMPHLPAAAVIVILQHVPLHERLGICALVCQDWAAAAKMATAADLNVELSRSEMCQQLRVWLRKNGGRVQRLSARPSDPDSLRQQLQLRVWQLVQLQRLELFNIIVQLAQGTATPGSSNSSSSSGGCQGAPETPDSTAPLLPQLQELRLANCRLTEQTLSQLLSATALSKLTWEQVDLYNDSGKPLPLKKLLSTLWQQLQQLPHLSELRLHQADGLTVAEAAPLSNLQHLKSLDILLSAQTHMPDLLALVPAGLTALRVSAPVDGVRRLALTQPGAAMPPAAHITRLSCSSLASLELQNVHLAPSCLSSLTGLRELRLCAPEYADFEVGPRELLGALQHLTQLQHLLLSRCRLPLTQQQDGYECFSALTASSQLTSLVLESTKMPVPIEAFDHMLPAGRVLPLLRELTFESDERPSEHCVGAAQVARIAASCPALQRLALKQVVHEDFDHSCLLQLPLGVTSVIGFADVMRSPCCPPPMVVNLNLLDDELASWLRLSERAAVCRSP